MVKFKINKIKVFSAIWRDGGMSGDAFESEGYVVVNNKKYDFYSNPGDGLQVIDLPSKFTENQIEKIYDKIEKAMDKWYKKNYEME